MYILEQHFTIRKLKKIH